MYLEYQLHSFCRDFFPPAFFIDFIRVLLVQCSIFEDTFPEQVATGKAATPGLEYPEYHLYL